MLSSMTGFASAAGEVGDVSWSFEVKSVNGRGHDLRLYLPTGCEKFEAPIREKFKRRFSRGNMQANLNLRNRSEASAVQVNSSLLSKYARMARMLDRSTGGKTTAGNLLEQKGVLQSEKAELTILIDSAAGSAIMASVDETIGLLQNARQKEGEAIFDMLSRIVAQMKDETSHARATAELQPSAIMTRLKSRVGELLEDSRISEERLEQELALLVSKADVTEEVDRLAAHLVEAESLLNSNKAVGRKLDFLSQELLREANTLGSKSASLEMTRHSLALKSQIDQFKEQAANVE